MALPTVIAIISSLIFLFSVQTSMTSDTEYWGEYAVKSTYYEDWDERVSCRHSYDCFCSTDSDGYSCCCSTCHEHSYDVDYHSPYWQVTSNIGSKYNIAKTHHNELTKRWSNNTFVDLGRDYHNDDGDSYVTSWKQKQETFEVITSKHKYKNKVQASTNVFNFPEVSEIEIEEYNLFEYPEYNKGGSFNYPTILGWFPPKGSKNATQDYNKATRSFDYINGMLGANKQVRTWVLIYKDKPREAGHAQEALWKGGNKNELIIAIGVDTSHKVKWTQVISWSESHLLKEQIKGVVLKQEHLDLAEVSETIYPMIKSDFVRKPFAEFDYLKVRPKNSHILWNLLITVIICLLVSVFVVVNPYEENKSRA